MQGKEIFKYELCFPTQTQVVGQPSLQITKGNQRTRTCPQTAHVQGYTQNQVNQGDTTNTNIRVTRPLITFPPLCRKQYLMIAIDLTPIHTGLLLLLLNLIRHRMPLLHHRKAQLTLPPPPILTRIPRIRHAPPLQMPLLNAPNNIDTQLPIFLQRVLPMLRDRVAERQIARDRIHHHLAHGIILARVGVHILHPSQPRIGFVSVIEGADGLDDVVG